MTEGPRVGGRRVVVVGVAGSGKTTFALELARRLGLRVVHLDNIADRNGRADPSELHAPMGEFPDRPFVPRPLDERRRMAAAIGAEPAWIAEGSFIEWIGDLLSRADTIVWLDQVGMWSSVRSAVARAFRSRGRARPDTTAPGGSDLPHRPSAVRRVRRLAGHGLGLAREVWDVAGYHWWRRSPGVARDIADGRWDRVIRRDVAATLEPYRDRVIRVRRPGDRDDALDRVARGPVWTEPQPPAGSEPATDATAAR